MSDEPGAASVAHTSPTSRLLGVAGILLYLAVGWLYLGSGLVVPFPWVWVLWAIWVGGLIVVVRVFRTAPIRTPLIPLAAVGVWVAFVQLGAWIFGWTA